MAKQMHPADAADRAKIAHATHFNVHLRKGPTEKINQEVPTLAEAVKIADALKAEYRKPAMIYAVTPEGFTVFVPQDMADAARQGEPPAEPDAELSNKQIAQLTAILTGGGFKRANSKEAAIARFLTVAEGAGLTKSRAQDIVKGPFDFAEHILREHLAGKPMTIPEVHAARDGAVPASAEDYPAPAPRAERKPGGKRAEALEAAQRGELPAAPDFSAATHQPHRKKLEAVIALVKVGDIEGLKAFEIKLVSTSPRAIARYRDLAVIALEARLHAA